MMLKRGCVALALLGGACEATEPEDADTVEFLQCDAEVPGADLTACTPNGHDYMPGGDDPYGACAPDDGSYPLISDTPSSIARVQAAEEVRMILRGNGVPTPDDFTAARAVYSEAEGLESRLQRREDLHFAPIPEEDWDPGVESDKQCTVPANVEKYASRCAGPSTIAPLINDAFAAGQLGEGDPAVHAARIDAAITWFLYLSVYKEANTCFTGKAKDCDSSWAYYTGGFDREGGIGFSARVKAVDEATHTAIWDGIAAFRCLRELVPADDDPTIADLDADARGMLCHANAQLDTALVYGLAQVVRSELETYRAATPDEQPVQWAFLQVLGPVLRYEGEVRNASLYGSMANLWMSDVPAAADIDTALSTIDELFPCS